MNRLLLVCMFLFWSGAVFTMEQVPAEQELSEDDFVMVEPSNQMINDWLQEALQEKITVDVALDQVPVQTQQEITAWQSFKNKLAAIPQGIGYLGRAVGVLSSSRWYLETTLAVILKEEENRLSDAEKNSFKAIRARVKEVIDKFEREMQDIHQDPDAQRRATRLTVLPGEFLNEIKFIVNLESPSSPFGVLSPNAHLLLLLTYLKEIRVIEQENEQVTELFKVWAQFVTDFTAELLNTRKVRVNGKEQDRNPHANTNASVIERPRGSISKDEKDVFLPQRRRKNVEAQRKLFDKLIASQLNVGPVNSQTSIKIGLVMSGGGYRAMTLAAGYVEALEQLGILDAASHISCLSGSTWFLSAWLQSGKTVAEFNKDLATRMPYMQVDYLALNAFNDPVRKTALHYDILFPKFAFKQPIGSVDLYGWLLSQAVLQGDYTIGISDQWQLVKDGNYPFPVYTTISMHNTGTEGNARYRYNWYEVNPLEFENVELGLAIPTWSLGREFKEGRSVRTPGLPTYPFEQSFGYMLATFGSAYTINFLKEGSKFVPGAFQWILNTVQLVKNIKRLWPAQSNNPWVGLQGQPSWVQNKPLLTFVDAGIDFNLPIPSLLKKERGLDLIIISDASGNIQKNIMLNDHAYPAEFGKFLLYMHNVNFDPSITAYHIADVLYEPAVGDNKAPFLAFKPKEGEYRLPWLVYINYIKDPELVAQALTSSDEQLKKLAQIIDSFDPIVCERSGFCGTFNFKYSTEQFEQLKSLGQFNILAHKEQLLKALDREFLLKSVRIACPGCMAMGAYKGNITTVESYLARGIDVNTRTEGIPGPFIDDAITALHAAALQGKQDVAKILLENGAGINQVSSHGVLPLDGAVAQHHPDMVRFLLSYRPEISERALHDAQNQPEILAMLKEELTRRDAGKQKPVIEQKVQEVPAIDEQREMATAQLQRLEERQRQEEARNQAVMAQPEVEEQPALPAALHQLGGRLYELVDALRAMPGALPDEEPVVHKRD